MEFDPWLKTPFERILVAYIDSIIPNPALDTDNIHFNGHGKTATGEIIRYAWRSSIDGEIKNDTDAEFDHSDLSVGEHTIYFKVENSSGTWSDEVNATLIIHEKPIASIYTISPDPALDTDNAHFEGHGTDDGSIKRYAWRSSIDGEFYNGTEGSMYYDGLSNGTHTIYFMVKDDNGVWSNEVSTTLMIKGKPRAEILGISPNPALDLDYIHFEGKGTDDGLITRYAWRSSIDGEFYNDTDSDFYNVGLSLGEHFLYFKVEDNEGIWSDEVPDTVIVTEKPVAKIDSISPDLALGTETVSFKGHGTDDGSITKYNWQSNIDGELYFGIDNNFTISNLSLGEHNITLQVQDNIGVWSDAVNFTLIISQKPMVFIGEIRPTPALNTDTITFSIGNVDCRCGNFNITRYVWHSSIHGELYNGTSEYFTFSGLSNGTNIIYLKGQNNYGFWSDEVNTTFVVNGKPLCEITEVSPNPAMEGIMVSFKGSGTDDGLIERYAWRVDDLELYNGTESSFTLSTLSVGTHTIFLKIQDTVGAWSEEVSTSLIITEYIPPNQRPSVIITSPANNSDVTGTITIKGSANDPDGTAQKVEVSINGGEWIEVIGTDSWNYEWDTTTRDNRDYEIRVRVYDGEDYSGIVIWKLKVENEVEPPDDNDDGGDNDGGGLLPGFELVILFASIFISVTIKRRI